MKRSLLPLGFLLAGLAFLPGCQNTVNTIENADKNAAPNVVADKRYVTDGFLRDRLRLQSVRIAPGASGNMAVEVAAVNTRTGVMSQLWSGVTGENPYKVAYKFIWQDENGMTVETPLSLWQTVMVRPGETVYFRAVAPNTRCRDFVLNLKEAN